MQNGFTYGESVGPNSPYHPRLRVSTLQQRSALRLRPN